MRFLKLRPFGQINPSGLLINLSEHPDLVQYMYIYVQRDSCVVHSTKKINQANQSLGELSTRQDVMGRVIMGVRFYGASSHVGGGRGARCNGVHCPGKNI
jgi:hypothetical protein